MRIACKRFVTNEKPGKRSRVGDRALYDDVDADDVIEKLKAR